MIKTAKSGGSGGGETDDKSKPRRPRTRFEAREIPDAERREFRTASGRPVRDGGGIEPDVMVKKQASFLEAALMRQSMFFKYANRYAAERGLDTLPEPFVVTDAVFRDFMGFVSSSKFRYESQFDDAFDELDSMFDSIGYDSARGRVADLRRATEQEMREDFVRHETELRTLLESAIRFRLQPDSVRIKAELRNDEQLAEAVRVLQNPREYNSVLQPPPKVQQAIVDAAKDPTELNG